MGTAKPPREGLQRQPPLNEGLRCRSRYPKRGVWVSTSCRALFSQHVAPSRGDMFAVPLSPATPPHVHPRCVHAGPGAHSRLKDVVGRCFGPNPRKAPRDSRRDCARAVLRKTVRHGRLNIFPEFPSLAPCVFYAHHLHLQLNITRPSRSLSSASSRAGWEEVGRTGYQP